MTKIIQIPGLIDCHVHLRDPGATQKEDFFTGSCAALCGGIVGVLDMPNNPNPTVDKISLKKKRHLAKQKFVCDYGFYLAATEDNFDAYKLAKHVFGLKIYMDHTTGPLFLDKLAILTEHFRKWPYEKPILVHAEDANVAKAIGLALTYKKWLHICHVSKKSEIDLIYYAKKSGIKITCEVTPHHLFLSQNDKKDLKGYGIMRPPINTNADKKALWDALNLGIIDYIATDHAPHTKKEKESAKPPFGVTGLETMLPLMLTAVKRKKLSLKKFIQLTWENPRKIHSLKQKNSWVEVETENPYFINNKRLKTKCGWTPFNGLKVYGKVKKVYLRGKKAFDGKKILLKKGFGKSLNDK